MVSRKQSQHHFIVYTLQPTVWMILIRIVHSFPGRSRVNLLGRFSLQHTSLCVSIQLGVDLEEAFTPL